MRQVDGAPVVGATVTAFEVKTSVGVDVLESLVPFQQTDAEGAYRLTGLPPGRYIVHASPGSPSFTDMFNSAGRPFSVDASSSLDRGGSKWTVFHPSARFADSASIIQITSSGQEQIDVNLTVPRSDDGVTVSGRVAFEGGLPASARVRLVKATPDRSLSVNSELAYTRVRPDGGFSFDGVPPGSYLLRGIVAAEAAAVPGHGAFALGSNDLLRGSSPAGVPVAPLPATPASWFSLPIHVGDQPIAGLQLSLTHGSTIRGRFVFDPGPAPNPGVMQTTALALRNASGWNLDYLPIGPLEADGSFVTPALPPGTYALRPMWRSVWLTERTMVAGQDIGGRGIVIDGRDVNGVTVTVTQAAARVSGTARDTAGRPLTHAAVILFPADRRDWAFGYVGTSAVSSSGAFDVTAPAGRYLLAAVTGEIPSDWRQAAFFERLAARATPVRLERGQQITQPLTAFLLR